MQWTYVDIEVVQGMSWVDDFVGKPTKNPHAAKTAPSAVAVTVPLLVNTKPLREGDVLVCYKERATGVSKRRVDSITAAGLIKKTKITL